MPVHKSSPVQLRKDSVAKDGVIKDGGDERQVENGGKQLCDAG